MIEAKNLSKRFGAVEAVRDVSFAARDGEITGILGANGAGKSTCLRMLYGVLTPDSGQACIDGMDIGARPPRPARIWACCRMRRVFTAISRRARTSAISVLCTESAPAAWLRAPPS
jgi:ABC-type multidrug transport system ATPase subunit